MEQLESVGWVRVEKKESFEMTELDVDEIFKMIDVDKSGAISRSVSSIFNCFFSQITFNPGGSSCLQIAIEKIWN